MWADSLNPLNIAFLAVLAFGIALFALFIMARQRPQPIETVAKPEAPETAFLFQDGLLVDSTAAARRLLDLTASADDDLTRLARFLAPRFPTLFQHLDDLPDAAERTLAASDSMSHLKMRRIDDRLHLALEDTAQNAPQYAPDRHCLGALFEELKTHRTLSDAIPFPMWRQTQDGKILWANSDYRAIEALLGRKNTNAICPSQIFPEPPDFATDKTRVQRVKLELPQEAEPRWFEYQISWVDDDLFVAAIPCGRVVRAERSLNGFVQTLTQTFAHLNVGLAVFSRTRELAIFNPALTALLELSPEFLIQRPTLFQVFDRLREQRIVPEPKDYKTWRRKMSALEAAATDSAISETWSLVDGRTFRVTGRPHPEGAVAFLFEDISEEITLERKFRADLQLGHAVIDGLDEAISVYSTSGELVFSNKAYREFWPSAPGAESTIETFVESTRLWQNASMPTPVWGDARDFAATIGERANWTAEIRLRDGRSVDCRFETLEGGFTLAGFSESLAITTPVDKKPRRISA